jgi:hypothetical protein
VPDLFRVDVKTDRAMLSSEGNSERQTDVTQTDDANNHGGSPMQ